MNWNNYKLIIERVANEDGGGFRAYYPTLGFAPCGVGDTLDEALECLDYSKQHYVEVNSELGLNAPEPSFDDRAHVERESNAGCNNYAFAV